MDMKWIKPKLGVDVFNSYNVDELNRAKPYGDFNNPPKITKDFRTQKKIKLKLLFNLQE